MVLAKKSISLYLSSVLILSAVFAGYFYLPDVSQAVKDPPTVVDYSDSDEDDSLNTETTGSLSWQTGDIILVFGGTENGALTLNNPTATGLTFGSPEVELNLGNSDSLAKAYLWYTTAGSNGSGSISATRGDSVTGYRFIAAYVIRGSDGIGNTNTITNSSSKTISLTRGGDNSIVLTSLVDWNALTDTTVTTVPSGGNQRLAYGNGANYGVFVLDWGDQGSAGTASYGITDQTGTSKNEGIAVEVKGTVASGDSNVAHVNIRGGGPQLSSIYPGTETGLYAYLYDPDTTEDFTVNVDSGSNRILFVGLGTFLSGDVTSVTYNGVSMTKLWSEIPNTYDINRITGWILVNPATGSNTLSVTIEGIASDAVIVGHAQAWYGVSQTGGVNGSWRTPVTATNAVFDVGETSASVNVANAEPGDLVLDAMVLDAYNNLINPVAPQVERYDDQAPATLIITYVSSSKNISKYSDVMQWTIRDPVTWAMGAVSLIPASSDRIIPSVKIWGNVKFK